MPLSNADETLPVFDMGWLHLLDPRTIDDEDFQGCEIIDAASALELDNAHRGRIRGRLRERLFLWRQVTSDKEILRIIEHGHEIPLSSWPPVHFDDNNYVPVEIHAWLDEQLGKLAHAGAIVSWEDHSSLLRAQGVEPGARPHVVLPICVVPKGSGGWRLIHNARWLNNFVEYVPCELDDIGSFCKQLRRGDRLWGLDLAQAYYHVDINWRFRTLLGFAWRGRLWVFAALTMGLSSSCGIFVRVAGVPARVMRERGLVDALCHYVDDFIGSNGPSRDRTRALLCVKLLLDLGFALAPTKLRITLDTVFEGLGHVLNTQALTITITGKRRLRMAEAIEAVWKHTSNVSARAVAKVAGHITSSIHCYGIESRIRSRYLLLWISRVAVGGDFSRRGVLAGKALDQLSHWRRRVRDFAEQPMHRHRQIPTWTIDCDASDRAVAGIVRSAPLQDWVGRHIRRELSARERRGSSTLREMKGYAHTVRTLVSKGVITAGDVLEIVGDSRCALSIFRKGGSQAAYDEQLDELQLLEALIEILDAVASVGAGVYFRWVRRDLISEADALSKFVDIMDFGLSEDAFLHVRNELGPCDIDAFAAPHNAVLPRFFSRHLTHSAEATDAFSVSWAHARLYILPDFSRGFIDRVLDKIERDNASVICIVPNWPRKRFWVRLSSSAWAERIVSRISLPPDSLVPHAANAGSCFFGNRFDSPLMAFATRAV